jgi:stage V sporulation protein SpoVS
MTFSAQFSACASTIDEGHVQTYAGPCCIGQAVARLDVQGSKRWVSDDGRAVVSAPSNESLSVEQQAANAVFLVIAREGSTRELRVNDVFSGRRCCQ